MDDRQHDADKKPAQDHAGELFSALQRLLPQHTLSRLLGKLADSRHPRLKHFLIQRAMARYGIELEEAALPTPEDYPSFNDFFTRRLRESARPIDASPDALVSPADGAVSQLGEIRDGTLFQAKGHHFSTRQLLGVDEDLCARFHHGSFATIYLSPRDYHRVHMPCDGRLLETLYIPGRLFSVNDTTVRHIPGLFARNERLVCLFDTEHGLLAVVLVGAILVAGIRTTWRDYYKPDQCHHDRFAEPRLVARGEELGQFRFGSTVVIATESPVTFADTLGPGSRVDMGGKLGEWR
ncbi:MAG: archaetidylserine decarboxylase [Bacteroidales bacterium]|nr:archaetidylserine decarboxylase [Bacteroidales bacterium]